MLGRHSTIELHLYIEVVALNTVSDLVGKIKKWQEETEGSILRENDTTDRTWNKLILIWLQIQTNGAVGINGRKVTLVAGFKKKHIDTGDAFWDWLCL